MRKVTVSAIKGGDHSGHLKVSHPDFPDGSDFYADKDDVSDAMSSADDAAAGKKLSEVTGLTGKLLSEQIPAIKERFATKVITLSDVPVKADGPDKGAPDFAKLITPAGSLIAAEVFDAQAKETVLSEAIEKRQILPKERVHLRKLSLSDLREYLAERTTKAVDESEHGHAAPAGEGKGTAFAELDTLAKKLIADKRASTYGDALRIIASENPELRKRYSEEQLKEVKN